MIDQIKVSRKDIAAIVAATFPDYSGRKFKIEPREKVYLSDLNWSGGSRSQYRACTLDGTALGNADRFNAMAPWDKGQIEGQSLPLLAGTVVVRHSYFCGKDMGLVVYCHPTDMPKYLPRS